MPQGKNNKAKRSNPKKKGKVASKVSSPPSSNSRAGSSNPIAAKTIDLPSFPTLKSFRAHDNTDSHNSRSVRDSLRGSLYFAYKDSTQRFKDALFSLVPAGVIQSDRPREIIVATDYVAEHELDVEYGLLNDLKDSIRHRRQVAIHKYHGGDEEHEHFIQVLEYSWSVLAPRRKLRMAVAPAACKQKSETDSLRNRFEKLGAQVDDGSVDDDTEDETDDEDDLPQAKRQRPLDNGPTRLTLQELIDGTDRTNCILFVFTLNELMRSNARQFKLLQTVAAMVERQRFPPSTLVPKLMEASVAVNFAIQQVVSLEQAFVQDNPHLNTIY